MIRALFIVFFIALAGAPAMAQTAQFIAHSPDEIALVAADAARTTAVANIDLEAIERLTHPNLRVNAPNGAILAKADLIRMVGSGEIGNDVVELIPEAVTITGDVGIVMGREVVRPRAGSGQARTYGQGLLNRRYTNVYFRVDGEWRHLARHANVVPAAAAR